jgi:diguanylate cyclase (GGDEF)-like protein
MIDIDHFKDYNDRYGHSAGDKVLLGIADIIRNNIRESYTVARYGGEEFLVILPNTDKPDARAVAEKIKEDISRHPFILRRQDTRVTVSCGVAAYSNNIKEKEELLKEADFCLYKAKREGRNKVCVA